LMPRPNLAVCFRARGVRLLLALAPDVARGLALALFMRHLVYGPRWDH
jgi:hypothetical protein